MLAPRHDAPKLSRQMLKAADRLMSPILLASFELEFVKLSHYVIESVLQAQRDRFNASERLFLTYAEALRKAPDMAGRLAILASTLGLELGIEDAVSGVTIVETRSTATQDTEHVERIPIAGRSRTHLIMSRTSNDATLVRSLVGLLGAELERMMIQRDLQREEGTALLRSLLGSETQFSLALPLVERRGLSGNV